MSKAFYFHNAALFFLIYQTDILLKMGVNCLLLSQSKLTISVLAWL